ncbi:MAG: flagellar basal body-associated protein FliL [Rhodobacteraceae bacterium]|nr:MAG: flagellar basal body-associated protein FliL [Paracoccaceae bacterium]
MSKILPIVIVLIGLGVGAGAGIFLRPAAMPPADGCQDDGYDSCDKQVADDTDPTEATEPDPDNVYYVKLSRQFVVPVVKDGRVSSMVVMSLSIETTPTVGDVVFAREPKLRDALLGVMFLHANSGGFDGQFTSGEAMKDLRGSLLEAAREVIGGDVYSVLVTDILRQDV